MMENAHIAITGKVLELALAKELANGMVRLRLRMRR